ncbi:hypothetical protein Pint_23381 [Pistacia integerrima]|uniref:Uncharacterized protein n=1 Tax=Pistacia integerrima TaxID=434235 RepID=A0ACC0YGC9_9ROSI|nr:hypothetical protein Pint_23381 [Pistacia integerrima]
MNSHTKMAVNSSTHCALPLNRPLLRRVPPAFFIRTSTRPIFPNGAPKPRLVSVRANNDGFGSKNSVNLKNSEAQVGVSNSSTSSAVDFLTLCNRLKTTKRKGWINHGIKGPESIADHMYRMALMALIAGDIPGVDRERILLWYSLSNITRPVQLLGFNIPIKWQFLYYFCCWCIKIAIVHDIAEAIVGDITPSDNVPKEVKSRMEQAALDEMCKVLGGGMRAEEIRELWAEYENNASIEANLVKDFDKVCSCFIHSQC